MRERGVPFVLDLRTQILRDSDHDVGTPGFDRILALDIRSLAKEVYSTSVEVTNVSLRFSTFSLAESV